MASRRRHLELKAVDPDPERTLGAALALGADEHGVVHQRDTYFHAVQGRLKLREAPPEPAELIAYARADRSGPSVSHGRVVPVADPIALAEALADVLGVRAVVEKTRRLLLWRTVRIHLDRVAGLGDFVELQAVAASPGGLTAEQVRIDEARTRLALTDDLLVDRGYADLLPRGSGAWHIRPA
ncbi:MAG TPA: class IV adenylate cyclase [Solirubrobacteraceae bacterium]|nr:class IV adenylate cyclase [Solirubrobacteraceae bacterium]